MRLSANETTMPRLHMIGTLALVLLVTLALAAFYSWRNTHEQNASFQRMASLITTQQHQRLQAEMQSAMGYMEFLRKRTEEVLRRSLVEQVDAAYAVAQTIYERESPHRPEAEVRSLIVEALRHIRFFDGRGYIFIDSMQGEFILLPTAPEMEGRPGINNRDDTGAYIMQGLINAAYLPQGQSFFHYRWYHPAHPERMAKKTAYVRHFAPYDWLIGTGDYLHEWEMRQQQEALERLRALRFGISGSIGVLDQQGRVLLSAGSIRLEQQLPASLPIAQATALGQIMQTAQNGGGFLDYEWARPNSQADEPLTHKTALVSTYKPWDWILVTTTFNEEQEAALATQAQAYSQDLNRQRKGLFWIVLGILTLGLLGSWGFSRWSGHLFSNYHRELQQAQENQRIAAIAFESQEGMLVTNPQGLVLQANQSLSTITGYDSAEVIGQNMLNLLQCDAHSADFYAEIRQSLHEQGAWTGEMQSRRKDGGIYPLWVTASAVKNEAGVLTHFVCALSDITHRKQAEEEIRRLAFYDPLTALPNRRLLLDRLQHAVQTSSHTQGYGALMFIDLDNFKLVNDSLGHAQGDLLLREMAQRLSSTVRQGDTVARLGGDEFMVVLENLSPTPANAALQAKTLAQTVLNNLALPMQLAHKEVQTTCSIGVVLFSGEENDTDSLMKHADLAMYQAKEMGRNTVCFFDPEMHAKVMQRMALEQELRQALENEQLLLHYQPQVNAQGTIVGAEALVRWQHPERGLVSPGQFIPLAEETGLILPLGIWVLNAACKQLALWAQDPQTQHLSLAINISERQLRQADFVQQVLQALACSGASPLRLKLEITESLLMQNPPDAIAKMSTLQAHGLRFSLDDFGTGYSSMAYLRQLPLHQLKIDQSFVQALDSDLRSAAIVRTIVTLAKNLGLEAIAEGVETAEQRQALIDSGCLLYQGYFFGRPAPALALSPKA